MDAEALAGRLNALRGRPWTPWLGDEVRSRVLEDPRVLRAQVRTNPFGRASVRLELRRPVAALGRAWLSEDGVWVKGHAPEGLPALKVPAESLQPSTGLAGLGDGPRLAAAVQQAQKSLAGLAELELSGLGVLSLRWKAGHRAVLGSWNRLDEKLAVAAAILGARKAPDPRVLNVTSPESPVWSSGGR